MAPDANKFATNKKNNLKKTALSLGCLLCLLEETPRFFWANFVPPPAAFPQLKGIGQKGKRKRIGKPAEVENKSKKSRIFYILIGGA